VLAGAAVLALAASFLSPARAHATAPAPR
jgi:hypothetical protein